MTASLIRNISLIIYGVGYTIPAVLVIIQYYDKVLLKYYQLLEMSAQSGSKAHQDFQNTASLFVHQNFLYPLFFILLVWLSVSHLKKKTGTGYILFSSLVILVVPACFLAWDFIKDIEGVFFPKSQYRVYAIYIYISFGIGTIAALASLFLKEKASETISSPEQTNS